MMAAAIPAAVVSSAATAASGNGPEEASVRVFNATDGPIACTAAIAHWFSIDLGQAEAGAAMIVPLRRDLASATIYLFNEAGEALPVERVWCGRAGRSWRTRAGLALPRHAGDPSWPRAFRCTEPDVDGGDRRLLAQDAPSILCTAQPSNPGTSSTTTIIAPR